MPVYTSTVKVENVYLNWTNANGKCTLIDFFSVKSYFDTLLTEMVEGERYKYWIKDKVQERSIVTKGK
jgi:hypothetical protein